MKPKPGVIIVLDLDGTLTRRDTVFDFASAFGRRRRALKAYRECNGDGSDIELDFREILRDFGAVSQSVFDGIASAPLRRNAAQFMSMLGSLNRVSVCLATATYRPIALKFADRLGIPRQNVASTELSLAADGSAIGFAGPVMEGSRKAGFVAGLSRKAGLPLSNFVGIGDSSSDLPFLSAIARGGGMALSVKKSVEFEEAGVIPVMCGRGPDFRRITEEVLKFAASRGALE